MIARLVVSLVGPILIGLLTIGCLWQVPLGLPGYRIFSGFLGVGIGFGLCASAFYGWLAVVGGPDRTFPLAELALALALAALGLYLRKRRGTRARETSIGRPPLFLPWLSLALWLGVGCSLIAFLVESAVAPQGGWDAWMTWNMHARAIFRGGEHWSAVLTTLPAWSHPDYPLLVPASVARIWTYLDQETVLAPATIALLFTFATAGLLYASLSILRSPTQGALAALLLLGTKFFILHGASQFADIPLSFFFLATLALLCLSQHRPEDRPRLLALAGLTAGLSAWTKNEGLLFLLVVLLVYGFAVAQERGVRVLLREAGAFVLGLAPVLCIVISFKIWLAPPSDLMADHNVRQIVDRLLDGSRYGEVLGGFLQASLEIGAKGVVGLVLLVYAWCAGLALSEAGRRTAAAAALVVVLMIAGYAAVLLTAPAPLLGTNVRSINRLLLQLWPSALLAYFLGVRSIDEIRAGTARVGFA